MPSSSVLTRLVHTAAVPLCTACAISALHAQSGPLAPGVTLTVTPSPSGVTRLQYAGTFWAVFTVKNTGTTTASGIVLDCSTAGSATCINAVPDYWASLAAGASFKDSVSYTTGAAGSASVTLVATPSGERTFSGTQNVTVVGPPSISLVVPVLTSGTRAVVRNREPLILATVVPAHANSPVDTTKTVLLWRSDTVTALARANRGLVEWQVDSTHRLAIGDSALITETACATNYASRCCAGLWHSCATTADVACGAAFTWTARPTWHFCAAWASLPARRASTTTVPSIQTN